MQSSSKPRPGVSKELIKVCLMRKSGPERQMRAKSGEAGTRDVVWQIQAVVGARQGCGAVPGCLLPRRQPGQTGVPTCYWQVK